jgi:hypothetical protein
MEDILKPGVQISEMARMIVTYFTLGIQDVRK